MNKTKTTKVVFLIFALFIFLIVFYFFAIKKGIAPYSEKEEIFYSIDETIKEANSPQFLAEILTNQFEFEKRESVFSYQPKDFFEKGKGGEQDFAAFAAYAFQSRGFISMVYSYRYFKQDEEKIGFVTFFQDGDNSSGYLYFDTKGTHVKRMDAPFNDIYLKEEERLNINIVEYGLGVNPYEWVSIEQ